MYTTEEDVSFVMYGLKGGAQLEGRGHGSYRKGEAGHLSTSDYGELLGGAALPLNRKVAMAAANRSERGVTEAVRPRGEKGPTQETR